MKKRILIILMVVSMWSTTYRMDNKNAFIHGKKSWQYHLMDTWKYKFIHFLFASTKKWTVEKSQNLVNTSGNTFLWTDEYS